MTPNCTQSLENGKPCNAPAINGSAFCRHHDQQRPSRTTHNEKAPETQLLDLPDINDKQAALVAINEIIQALAGGRIKRSVAQTLLSAINSITRLMDQIMEAGEAGITYVEDSQPHAIALAASSSSRPANDSVATKLPPSTYQNDVDPSTARLVKELLAQSHQLAKAQAGINRL